MAEALHHPRLLRLRPHRGALARPVPGLRRVEHAGRGARAGGVRARWRRRRRRRPARRRARARARRRSRCATSRRRRSRGCRPGSASSTACWAAASCPGSLVLLGGSPGIGKSTLTGMAMGNIAGAGGSDALRLRRGVRGADPPAPRAAGARRRAARSTSRCSPRPTSTRSLATIEHHRPEVCVIDSVQTLHAADLTGAPGSVGQVREVAGAADAHGQGRSARP